MQKESNGRHRDFQPAIILEIFAIKSATFGACHIYGVSLQVNLAVLELRTPSYKIDLGE